MLHALLLLSLTATPAAPIPNGALVGTLTDATTGRPLPDVVVTVRAPGLEAELLAVTDAHGHYRVPQLPPGVYALTFARARFEPAGRADVSLRLGRTVRVDVPLQPRAPETAGPADDCDEAFFGVGWEFPCVGSWGPSEPEALAIRPWEL